MLKPWLEILGHILLIGCGSAFVYIFGSIAVTGGYNACEPNPWVLGVEVGMGLAVTAVGINQFLDDVKAGRRNDKPRRYPFKHS